MKEAAMKCPRCKLPLRKTIYEGVETDMCDQCWGFWLDSGELEQVLAKREIVFSDEEKKEILALSSVTRKGPAAPAPCPKCGKTMQRAYYDEMVTLMIDQCADHGVWLDTGEIKKVQALAEKSEKFHRLLLRKLGLLK